MFSTILLVLASIGILKALPFDARDNIRVVNPGEALDSPVVSTKFGNWQGSSIGGVDQFLNIPFALPPIGPLRFAPPVADDRQHGNYDATAFGPACPQLALLSGALPGALANLTQALGGIQIPGMNASTTNGEEDCLQLNIFRPSGLSNNNTSIPVMFFMFGGAFLIGSTASYNGSSLVNRSIENNQPIMLVTVNYRVNSFGFLPGVEVKNDPSASVVAGLQDQRLALEWVADNIAAFGGDPSKVTIFGESSGAISTSFQVLAFDGDNTYKGKPLFYAAIMESGNPTPVQGADSVSGQRSYDIIAHATNCYGNSTPIACLRDVPFDQMLAATNLLPNIFSYRSVALPFLPRTDGVFLTDSGQNLLKSGKYAKVAMISGDQYDEGTLLTLGTLNITTDAEFRDWLSNIWFPRATSAQLDQILINYPADPTQGSPFDTGYANVITSQNKRISSCVGDFVFQAGRRAMMQAVQTTVPTWSYSSRVFKKLPILGSFHGSDILSVFGQLSTPPTAEVQSRWIAFANTLNPNVAGYPYWPQYGTDGTLLQFTDTKDPSSLVPDDFREAPMAYFESIADVLAF